MLESNVRAQLENYLQMLVNPVALTLATDSSPKSKELEELAQEIASMSDKISLTYGPARQGRTPVMGVARAGEEARIEFAGIPMGHEFTSLVLAVLHSGGHAIKISDAQREQIAALEGDYEFESYISLSCHNCPDVVQALNMMAVINPNIRHTMIDGALFQAEVNDRQVMAVPSVYLNGESFSSGRMTLTEILAKADTNASARQAKALSAKPPYDVLVVGGGPAGAAAAIYAARKCIRTGVVAERFGGQVLDTLSIENFISVQETEGPKLAAALEQHVLSYDVDVMDTQKVVDVRRKELIEVETASGAVLQSRAVILATGARWRAMNVPGEDEYRARGVAYCPHCDGPLFKGKKVAVIGGGNSGIEAAIDLAGLVEHVTVLEFADTLRADEVLQRKARSLPNVTIITSAQTTEVVGDGQKVTGLNYVDRASGEAHSLALAGIFVQIGLMPNSEWLQGKIELNERREVIVNGHGATSMAGVFAAGDVTNAAYKQIIISMGSGATAALGAFDHLIRG